MRLITKITLLYVILMFGVFSIGGLMTFRMVRDMVRQETDWALRSDTRLVVEAIKEGKPIDALKNQKIAIKEISDNLEEDPRGFFVDTLMMHRTLDRIEEFRKLSTTHKINDKHYSIVVADVFIETEDMRDGVVQTMTRLFIGLSMILLLFSFLFSRVLLKPFEKTLKKINLFNITSEKSLELPKTSTTEFKELNHFVTAMTEKARKDYASLKEFSENASHELQTPIAVIKGKLELLQESPALKEDELKLISVSQQSLSKLSKLGQSLSLLTKIENQEYIATKELNFSEVVRSAIETFGEFAELKNLRMTNQLDKDVFIRIEPSLADILVSNLIKNAIQHNIPDGWIEVILTQSGLTVSNSGNDPGIPTDQLLVRFKKSRQSSASLGLGLAIVNNICSVNNLKLSYVYKENVHRVVVQF